MKLIQRIDHPDDVELLKERLSFKDEGIDLFVELEDGSIEILHGLAKLFHAEGLIKTKPFDHSVHVDEHVINRVKAVYDNFTHLDSSFESRQYQIQGSIKSIANAVGLCLIPTGGGKTEVLVSIVRTLEGEVFLVLNDKANTVKQIRRRAVKRGIPEESIGDPTKKSHKNRDVFISTTKSLVNRIEKNDPEVMEIISRVTGLIFDEAHHTPAASWQKIIKACVNIKYFIGFTGTAKYLYEQIRNRPRELLLYGLTGGPVFSVTSSFLRQQGYLAEPFVHYLEYESSRNNYYYNDWRWLEEHKITKCDERNKLAVDVIQDVSKLGLKILVIVSRINHGEELLKRLRKRGIDAVFSSGGGRVAFATESGYITTETVPDPIEYVEKLLNTSLDVVIGSSVYDESADISGVDCGIVMGGGKSETRLLQRIGRSIRKKFKGLNIALIFDFNDRFARVTEVHTKIRRAECESEKYTIIDSYEQMLGLATAISDSRSTTENN
jgi:superfamily II DNA or RNA helicase